MTDDDHKGGPVVLKRDGRGRVRCTPEQRREAVAEFERSGLSGPAFCQVAGINYQTFVGWRKEARRKAASPAVRLQPVAGQPGPIRLTEVVLPAPSPSPVRSPEGLQVHLPGGACLVITDAAQVPLAAQLIQTLA